MGLNKHLYNTNTTNTTSALLETTRQRRWLISLGIAPDIHKLVPNTSKHIAQIQVTYLTNTASAALLDILLRQKGS